MVAFCSPQYSYSNMGWLFQELGPAESLNIIDKEKNYVTNLEYSSQYHQFSSLKQQHVETETPPPSPKLMVKKLNHNASERDRRKKVNSLISSLRSLLPGDDQTKKLSIPVTISRVLKYIPELQKKVEGLTKKKEELLSRISRQEYAVNKESQRKIIPSYNSSFVVSTSRLNDCELAVHISSYEAHKIPISEILMCLEDNELFLLNSSSSKTFGGRVFYNLHLQVDKTQRLECDDLIQKLSSVYERQRSNQVELGARDHTIRSVMIY
ncbi:transcription factor ORG2-like [Vicia villosa]|uniref:transcription factor ORG2-like n=1 Tax=Vicia villosa TaxID=3911 RepID=UPI00273B96EE|nr:transcription factor ORG2-like [Vicia villosa]